MCKQRGQELKSSAAPAEDFVFAVPAFTVKDAPGRACRARNMSSSSSGHSPADKELNQQGCLAVYEVYDKQPDNHSMEAFLRLKAAPREFREPNVIPLHLKSKGGLHQQ